MYFCVAMENKTIHRYFIQLSYAGTNYNGWQVQQNAQTVQGVLQQCMGLLLSENTSVTGAGRTDTGVHANQLFAHFDSTIAPHEMEAMQLTHRLNRMLPADIAIQRIFPVPDDAHARFHATSRSYAYHICTQKDPLWTNRAWLLQRPLCLKEMEKASQILIKNDDFSSFAKTGTQVKTNICRVDSARWECNGHLLTFHIQADRFLRNMVRAIVGTLIEVGVGNISALDVQEIIEKKNRSLAGQSVPACGLYLTRITYPPGIIPDEPPNPSWNCSF